MLPSYVIYFGLALHLSGQLSYLVGIIKGKNKPNLVTWILWTLIAFLAGFFQIKAGGGISALPIFMAGFGPLMVVILSLIKRNAAWKLSNFDIFCGFLALLSLSLYIYTHNLGIAIFFAILSDILALIPTVVKTWRFPETEGSLVFLFAAISNVLGLLVLKSFSLSTVSLGLSVIFQCLVVLFCIYRKNIFKTS